MKIFIVLFLLSSLFLRAEVSSLVCDLALKGSGTVYHDNGNVLTYAAGKVGATWYHSNGEVLTYSAGKLGTTLYYPNGEVITYSAGKKGATWYYANGQVITYSGPDIPEQEFLEKLCLYLE